MEERVRCLMKVSSNLLRAFLKASCELTCGFQGPDADTPVFGANHRWEAFGGQAHEGVMAKYEERKEKLKEKEKGKDKGKGKQVVDLAEGVCEVFSRHPEVLRLTDFFLSG